MTRVDGSTSTHVHHVAHDATQTSAGTSSGMPSGAPARARTSTSVLKGLKSLARSLGISSAAPKRPKQSLAALMHQEAPSKLTRAHLGVPQRGDSKPSSAASSAAPSRAPSRQSSGAGPSGLPAAPAVPGRGRVQFQSTVQTRVMNNQASDASVRRGTDKLDFASSLRESGVHTPPATRTDPLRAAQTTPQHDILVGKMVQVLNERMHGADADPDEAAEIKQALAAKTFPKSLVFLAQMSGLATAESRAAVVARFHELAADDAELAKGSAQHT